jgi:hypothetical protein
MILYHDQRSESLIQAEIQAPHLIDAQNPLQLLLWKLCPREMMLWALHDNLMGPYGIHDIKGAFRSSIEITLNPTQGLQIRGDSNPPASLIPLTRGLAQRYNLRRGHRLVTWAKRAWTGKWWGRLCVHLQGSLSIRPLWIDNDPTIPYRIAPQLTHISPRTAICD